MEDIIIRAKDLWFSYEGEDSHALNGLSLEIRRGHKVALMGANGSGKSTFFLCCNGIHRPKKGTLYFDGKPVSYDRKGLLELRSRVGIVFQDPENQLFSASVYQEISFGILNLGVSEAEAKREVEQVIDHLEITPFRHKPTHALSGGQKKQVSIADILVMHPEVIFFDEPAAALDPKHARMVNRIVDQLAEEGITVIVSTHDVDFACEWADDVFLFHGGRVLMAGTPEEVFTNRTALEKTNLEQPAAFTLFDSLCKKGILKPGLALPRNLKTLEGYIARIGNQVYTGGKESMNETGKKGLLAVSFGTSVNETREKTIDVIEADLREAFPEYELYRAWTSGMIIRKLQKRDGVHVDTVTEAVKRMLADGVTELIVQPTHVINGVENDRMIQDVLAFQKQFEKISFGNPLLTSEEDSEAVIRALMEEYRELPKEEALVFMGHGTTHYANSIYAALDYKFKDMGYSHVFLGTVEAYPSLETLLKLVRASGVKKVTLAPFMVVAGDHAINDMSSEDEESWRSRFEAEGFSVSCVLKGLGEYPGIRNVYVKHVKDVL
ncbi:MAG: sirohydrochlorin cobaltochelatase [Clostridiales bacterium]|nr:sirohydrochlorin cobaltochelatase [Clostridiales bacterium]